MAPQIYVGTAAPGCPAALSGGQVAHGCRAAERRKNSAHGASRGGKNQKKNASPVGATEQATSLTPRALPPKIRRYPQPHVTNNLYWDCKRDKTVHRGRKPLRRRVGETQLRETVGSLFQSANSLLWKILPTTPCESRFCRPNSARVEHKSFTFYILLDSIRKKTNLRPAHAELHSSAVLRLDSYRGCPPEICQRWFAVVILLAPRTSLLPAPPSARRIRRRRDHPGTRSVRHRRSRCT